MPSTSEPWGAWLASHSAALAAGGRSAELTCAAAREGALDLPLPGSGETAARFDALRAFGEVDPVFARLAEGHADAIAILAELGAEVPSGTFWGVWAAVPMSLTATRDADGWRIDGERPWCSGAGTCTNALVTANTSEGVRLFSVSLDDPGAEPVDDTWHAVGMAASDSRTVRFTAAAAEPVGEVGDYVQRPGFWHGSIGVAACWHGGAVGVARQLLEAARSRDVGPHAMAHLGAIDASLTASATLLDRAAHEIDADPKAEVPRLARIVKATAEATVTKAIDSVGRALGAGPLCLDGRHARRVADLTVYVRQSHAETDLAALGHMAADGVPQW